MSLHRVPRALWVPVVLAALLVACRGVPEKALRDAEAARKAAAFATKCAPDEYAAAQRMMDRARELVRKERYDEAEEAARTAQHLFEQAQRRAEAHRESCLKRLAELERAKEEPLVPEPPPDQGDDEYELTMVHFPFNAAVLTPEARRTLEAHARWLKAHPRVRIQISGHADERGSTEYNLALGQTRAEAVRKYLESLGIDRSRMAVLSYGEELPLVEGSTESAYRRNRRAEFKILSR